MKVLFDSQIFSAQEYGGISRYYANLARQLKLIDGVSASIFSPTYINGYLPRISGEDQVIGVRAPARAKTLSKIFNHITSHAVLPFFGADIIHKTYYYPERYPEHAGRSVLTVYDMIHELFPENFLASDKTSKYKFEAVMKADHVICISENTRSDLLKIWDCDPSKVSVVHLGFDSFQDISRAKKENYQERQFGDFILFVGSRSGHKNFSNLLKAFCIANELHRDVNLVCFGGGPFNHDEIGLIGKLGLRGHVYQVGGGDSSLGDFYRGASLFVYPSVYEGFGIPPLEAMSLGCPVSCSKASSLPEVCGDAADYFDPWDVESIASSLARVFNDSTYRAALSVSGLERTTKFSWHKCAMDTYRCYEKVLATKSK